MAIRATDAAAGLATAPLLMSFRQLGSVLGIHEKTLQKWSRLPDSDPRHLPTIRTVPAGSKAPRHGRIHARIDPKKALALCRRLNLPTEGIESYLWRQGLVDTICVPILVYSSDASILGALTHEGFDVAMSPSPVHAGDLLRSRTFAAVVVDCITMVRDSCVEVARWLERNKPGTILVQVASDECPPVVRDGDSRLHPVDYRELAADLWARLRAHGSI